MMRVTVGLSTCGIAAGAEDTFKALETRLAGLADAPELQRTGCVGMCYQEPLVEISNGDGERYLYGHVSPDKVGRLIDEHVLQGTPVADWLVWTNGGKGTDHAYLARQQRIVLRNCGNIDPESIDDYIKTGGYLALQKVLEAKDPDALIATMIESGLRGRGGAGFSTGMKWRFARDRPWHGEIHHLQRRRRRSRRLHGPLGARERSPLGDRRDDHRRLCHRRRPRLYLRPRRVPEGDRPG